MKDLSMSMLLMSIFNALMLLCLFSMSMLLLSYSEDSDELGRSAAPPVSSDICVTC